MAPAASEFGRRLLRKGGDDDVLFLAGGVAFNILLAGVPFFLLLAAGLGYALGTSAAAANSAVAGFIRNLFPAGADASHSVLDPVLRDIARTRGRVGLVGGVTFVWFSTRLFGSLRSVFNRVFCVPRRRGILVGKLHDAGLTLAATVLVVLWIVASAYIALARTRGVVFLTGLGLHAEGVMRPLTYVVGRALTYALLVGIFYSLYRVLPNRAVASRQAATGAVVSATLFEAARWAFALVVHRWNPATLYTGTLATIIVVVFWVYYAALIVILGGEASQVAEDMRE
ncbi:MAG TPA: YihY/virulence factor BrkB family protein [Gemmatimonadaceae bacterium]|nr:YihY/virulence factor BrkB family protein [Gemmatimonadaceae bacterium]